MDPFGIEPQNVAPEAFVLLEQAVNAFVREYKAPPVGEQGWTVTDLATQGRTRVPVPEHLRAWVVNGICCAFAEWALEGPAPVAEKLTLYPTLRDWAQAEMIGNCRNGGLSDTIVAERTAFRTFVSFSTRVTFLTELYGPEFAKRMDMNTPWGEAAVMETGMIVARLLDVSASLSPLEAWNGIGVEAQENIAADMEFGYKDTAFRYAQMHFGQWEGLALSAEQGDVVVNRLRGLVQLMTDLELIALAIHGVDRLMSVPDETWQQIRHLIETEQIRRVVLGPYRGFSQN